MTTLIGVAPDDYVEEQLHTLAVQRQDALDAQRYRWLVELHLDKNEPLRFDGSVRLIGWPRVHQTKESLDAAVDRQMQKTNSPPEQEPTPCVPSHSSSF